MYVNIPVGYVMCKMEQKRVTFLPPPSRAGSAIGGIRSRRPYLPMDVWASHANGRGCMGTRNLHGKGSMGRGEVEKGIRRGGKWDKGKGKGRVG